METKRNLSQSGLQMKTTTHGNRATHGEKRTTRMPLRILISGTGTISRRPLLAVVIGVASISLFASCGVKAPPQPRGFVVPAPVKDVAVAIVPDGLEITFTLPAKSLNGSPLEVIGGYRILREGPGGKDVRKDMRFSVSERRRMAGKRVAFLDDPPAEVGTYRYCVIPVDVYGSHPSRRQMEDLCWEGFLSGERVPSDEGGPSDEGATP